MSHAPGTVIKPLVKLGRAPGDCWEWLGTTNSLGVAHKTIGGKTIPARRWMWMQLNGLIPDGLVITTTCGSKTCVNPHHLRACFQCEANRSGSGVSLLPSDVQEIRRAKKNRTWSTAGILAERYGVSAATIRDVWARRSWNKPKPNNGPRSHRGESAAVNHTAESTP